MNDISEILRTLLDQYSRASDVCEIFKERLDSDTQLMADYKEWCEGNGYNEKSAYRDYVNELIDSRDSFWDNYADEN